MVDTSDDWIVAAHRHPRAPHRRRGRDDLGAGHPRGARGPRRRAASTPADIDLIIVATSTPDYTFPATATQVQAALGITQGAAFDLQAVCSGFVFALATADKFLTPARTSARW